MSSRLVIAQAVRVPRTGLVAAAVTAGLYVWIQRPRADLRMERINHTVEVAKWLARVEEDIDAQGARKH
jgi:hypothetical protein